jgi:hypothetical protein
MPITTAILLSEATDEQVLSFLLFFGFIVAHTVALLCFVNGRDE